MPETTQSSLTALVSRPAINPLYAHFLQGFGFMLVAATLLLGGCAQVETSTSNPSAQATTGSDLEPLTIGIANQLYGMRYSSNGGAFRDCSGIFHRVVQTMEDACPNLLIPPTKVRSSRQLAAWYTNHGTLTPMKNALLQAPEVLQPGAIVFFGGPNKRHKTVGYQAVVNNTRHIGIVTSVQHNETGELVGYQMFHGSSSHRKAVYSQRYRQHPKNKNSPPFGNGNEQLLAVATLCAKPPCVCNNNPALSAQTEQQPEQILTTALATN
jgi:hypothetical protein